MTRRLAQLDKVDRLERSGGSSLPTAARRSRGVRTIALGTAVLVGVGGVVWATGPWRQGRQGDQTAADTLLLATGHEDVSQHSAGLRATPGKKTSPLAGVDEHKTRLAKAPAAPVGSGGYAFLESENGKPLSYDPYRPIHYVIRDKATPPGGDDAVRSAVAAVSKATGLTFINDGMTGETPSTTRPLYQPDRYGERWAPVLIAWSDPKEIKPLAGRVLGVGGSTGFKRSAAAGAAGPAYVSGSVYLDAPDLATSNARSHGTVTIQAVIEHELGHLVGLDHVKDPKQLMYPEAGHVPTYGPGDLRGLAIEGSGSCHPEL